MAATVVPAASLAREYRTPIVQVADVGSELRALQAADLRLATIFYRLAKANVHLCRTRVPATGLVLHARTAYLGRYEAAADALFRFAAPVAVEGVVPASPAARLAIGDTSSLVGIAASDARAMTTAAQALDRIEASAANGVVDLILVDAGKQRAVAVPTEQVCSGRVEAQVSANDNAGTDGRTIQVTTELMNRVAHDDQLAAVVAHEFAHVILDHPHRLTEAGVARGLLRGLGRNRRIWRQTEVEADRLSAYLLANAGFDPLAGERFWKGAGRRVGGGLFGSGTHMDWRKRAALFREEASRIAERMQRPIVPDLLATRDAPLD